MKNIHLKEKSVHGESSFHFHIYHHIAKDKYYVSHHWHDEIEIVYVEKGDLELTIDNDTVIGDEGSFIFINPQSLHSISSIKSHNSAHYALVFSLSILSYEIYDVCQDHYIRPLLNGNLKFPILLNFENSSRIKDEILLIISSYQKRKAGWQLNIKASLLKIISLFVEEDKLVNEVNYMNIKKQYKIDIIKKLLNYIHENYQNKIYIDDLSRIANMNSQYLARFFKSFIGKTPIEYINNYRIERACSLIKNTNSSILDISMNVGFDNFSYFIKQFKKSKKCTPLQYRQK
ncbi:AraC-like DNA-binding protein/quercetin dioxygenase-like cupin family protein [Clostridium beijerinckii]|uniref:AraC-like DNA-binding protein/quercetin dioxygenase-like cupin family protein n=1 Tax=Clostridium beijerinckii TaxID=1520 RepID=A0AAX0B3R6_CLOBE|nr:AraC family transcriptional regulator [Clostridium beijerinckii]NRT33020.1 AraC-like DNA-binding protein/quercetin dioxygenase-like cupin family protein [Clostridium beijerinckii]NRT47555.1 AraC-like DNA-binding protein/quercetin dioxygenase-like cupin family protein [Clostridium beijerinckii]NRT89676.1 AraC-like DNA-binding protein/quercetin dioxygenase-like cupin family protein [Clostridium beijerinckii]NRZ24155.1 AraC-like DNA-binding protein/quercetin dioxygenase-like cupin family protei